MRKEGPARGKTIMDAGVRKMKVIVTESIAQSGIEILMKVEVDVRLKIGREELLKVIGDYHGIVVRSATV